MESRVPICFLLWGLSLLGHWHFFNIIWERTLVYEYQETAVQEVVWALMGYQLPVFAAYLAAVTRELSAP